MSLNVGGVLCADGRFTFDALSLGLKVGLAGEQDLFLTLELSSILVVLGTPLLDQLVGLGKVFLFVFGSLLLSLQLQKFFLCFLERLGHTFLFPFSLGSLSLQFDQMFPEQSILLTKQLQSFL